MDIVVLHTFIRQVTSRTCCNNSSSNSNSNNNTKSNNTNINWRRKNNALNYQNHIDVQPIGTDTLIATL